MDGKDEVINNVNNGAQSSIVKGKRTKRQRPQSPIPFRMITTNSYKSDQGSDICSNNNNNIVEDTTTTAATTTTVLSDDDDGAATTEEEEDMANCLILLAQGHSRDLPPQPLLKDGSNNNKFVSRKFMEAGKSGYYVYECKTCSKTFSSFQALGGHRASHKKPKNKEEDYNNANKSRSNNNFNSFVNSNYSSNLMLTSDDEDPPFKLTRHNNNNNVSSSTSLSLQLTNRALYSGITNHQSINKGRVHECSICGAEFSSGQALGGHMRRHRGPVNTVVGGSGGPPPIAAVPLAIEQPPGPTETTPSRSIASALSLDLDLNLPAPSDDNKEANMLSFDSNKQQQSPHSSAPQPPQQIVFSSPALVDCHY